MRRLPLDHALRNIVRRPVRSILTAFATGLIAALLVATAAFVRGLEASQLASAPPRTAILISTSAMGDIIRSAMSPAVAELVAADVPGVLRVGGVPAVSPEIHMGTDVRVAGLAQARQAFVRGVTERAFLVHDRVTLIAGRPARPGEAIVGRLAAAKCDLADGDLAIGRSIEVEGGTFTISGTFAAPGSAVESEIWVGLPELQGLAQREDVSCVFVRTKTDDDLADVELFALRRLDLELRSITAAAYYAELAGYFGPILALVWAMAALIGLAALTSGANTLVATVQDRTRELAALRAIGYPGGALVLAALQEALLLGAAGGLVGLVVARLALARASISLAMTAFRFDIDAVSILIGLGGVLIIVVLGTVPAMIRILRLPVARALGES